MVGKRWVWILSGTFILSAGVGCADRSAEEAEEAAAREAARLAELEAREAQQAVLEAERLAALWTYHDVEAAGGWQVTASILSSNDVDTGAGPMPVQLVFRDHPEWGQDSYLVLDAGDFDCAPACDVSVTAADGAPQPIAAHRPDTDDAIALLVDDALALWSVTIGADRISIEFPADTVGPRTATFDVAGLDPSEMPGW